MSWLPLLLRCTGGKHGVPSPFMSFHVPRCWSPSSGYLPRFLLSWPSGEQSIKRHKDFWVNEKLTRQTKDSIKCCLEELHCIVPLTSKACCIHCRTTPSFTATCWWWSAEVTTRLSPGCIFFFFPFCFWSKLVTVRFPEPDKFNVPGELCRCLRTLNLWIQYQCAVQGTGSGASSFHAKKTKVCLLLQAGKTFDLNIRVLEILLEKDTALKEFCNSKDDGRNNLIWLPIPYTLSSCLADYWIWS